MPWNGTIVDSQILAIHAAVVPSGNAGEVVLFGGDEHWSAQAEPDGNFHKTRVYDVETHAIVSASVPSPDSDVFCSHHAFAADGRLLIGGGTQKWPESGDAHAHGLDFLGHRRCWLYNFAQRTWVEAASFNRNPDQPDEPHSGGRWYPGLVTLGSGEVAAFFGHPDQEDFRHRNNLPERYNQGGNVWNFMPKIMGSYGTPDSGGRRFLFFPRTFVLPNGNLFFATPMPAEFTDSTEGNFFSTGYDPVSGDYVAPKIAPPPDGGYLDWSRPAVLLPLLPTEDYRVRILFCGDVTPRRLDLGAASPAWTATGPRDASVSSRTRQYSNAVILPTGEVCLTGGVNVVDPEDPVNQAEIYNPGINWNTGAYGPTDSWAVKEAGVNTRNYHSVSLLLPNGKVWVAGGDTNAQSGDPDGDVVVAGVTKKRGIKKIELYEPDYIATANRIQINDAPRFVAYGSNFEVGIDRAATAVKHVALIRAGSATHSTNNDQRYVGLTIASRDGNTLQLVAPPNGNIAPPGYYMLWVIDNADKPCQLARFVRLANVGCTVITDHSTFSREEVEALGGGGQATINNAIYVQFDGFINTELTGTPAFSARWTDTGATIPDTDFTLVSAGRLLEMNPGFADIPQRITYPFHVRFRNLNVYAGFTDTRRITLTFTLGGQTCSQTIELTYAPNPYMLDINPVQNNPVWLSTDVRVFSLTAGQVALGTVMQGMGDPIGVVRQALDRLNTAPDANALFESLSPSATLDLASSSGPFGLLPIFNYAIARVRYRATTTTAQRVKAFFRGFNVAATGLEFDPNTVYRRTPPGPGTVPLLGVAGGEVASIPFFASGRVETVVGQPGADSMTAQVLDSTYEIKDIVPNAAGAEVTVFFGCWLDINQTKKRFPIAPAGSDGPWPDAACRSIQDLVRGRHQCLVTEIFFEPDPTQPGSTPGTSDNLSQRNLTILHSDNPGGPDSHRVMHTFELKPSPIKAALQPVAVVQPPIIKAAAVREFGPDELMLRWYNLPPASEVTLYFSDVDTAEMAQLARLRKSPPAFEILDKHTIRLKVAGATWLPIPGGRTLHIPALLDIQLPDGIVYGQEFKISAHQVSGRTRRIIGSFEFRIPVSKAGLILDEEVRTLSVMKHILTTIPHANRWYPLMERYVEYLGSKVDALGGNATGVYPNPDGSGRPPGEKGGPEQPASFTGRVRELVYDCQGAFVGFVLESCNGRHSFRSCDSAVEKLVHRSCMDRTQLTVLSRGERIQEIIVHCC